MVIVKKRCKWEAEAQSGHMGYVANWSTHWYCTRLMQLYCSYHSRQWNPQNTSNKLCLSKSDWDIYLCSRLMGGLQLTHYMKIREQKSSPRIWHWNRMQHNTNPMNENPENILFAIVMIVYNTWDSIRVMEGRGSKEHQYIAGDSLNINIQQNLYHLLIWNRMGLTLTKN